MNITFIEPFYSGSHKRFTDQLINHSSHKFNLLTLEGRNWKWRLYGSAQVLADMFNNSEFETDILMVSAMMDLAVFISLTRKRLKNTPVVTYFHENQIAYPYHEEGDDHRLKRNLHYGMINYNTTCVSDYVLFNSSHNMESFYDGIGSILKKMPDNRHDHKLTSIREKSMVMPLGLELKPLLKDRPFVNDIPVILWNHRWEFDKDPDTFFKSLYSIKDKGIPFKLIIAGQSYKNSPDIFYAAKERLKDEIIHFGYPSHEEYVSFLNMADILPVTSIHDFFGISVMEAIHCGAFPLLPKDLAYPEIYNPAENPGIFYDDFDDLCRKLEKACNEFMTNKHLNNYSHISEKYDWSNMIEKYNEFFSKICKL